MKRLKVSLIILLIPACLAALYYYFNLPVNPDRGSAFFTVDKGETVRSVASSLKNKGFIRSDIFFISLTRLNKKTSTLKAGEYELDYGMKNSKILEVLSKGIVVTVKFTIPEGYNLNQIAMHLEAQGIIASEDFLAACSDKALLDKYDIPFETAEGFLFPDTYIVAKGLGGSQIAEIMIKRFFDNLHDIPYVEYTEEELIKTVIIASLVEKEAQLAEERAIIAAVFYNRLKKGKRLESCATVQYVLGKTKERLLFSDLKIESPYNTYLHSGLPPGPIANPGVDSLKAAISPAEVDYLFFVSKRDGSHYFSSTYTEHLNAIKKYSGSDRIGHQLS
jgi:UPF0755 protein